MQKILIVEDDRDIASIERDHPELNGYQVEIAPDGISGLARDRSGEFDLILLDLTLPGVDGFAVCRQLREDTDQLTGGSCQRPSFPLSAADPRVTEAMGDNATVAVHINRLREKLERDPGHPRYIHTVWGAGYRFRVQ